MARAYSVVQLFPEDPGHHCGYCKSTDGFIAQGVWAHTLNVQEYQGLMDRGWRRSGCYCYKPVMDRMCCPPYTIRCDAPEVRLTKSQKKVAKRMRNFLLHGNAKLAQGESSQAEDTVDGSVEHGHMDLEIDAQTLERMASRASGDLPQGSSSLLNGDLTDGPSWPRAADGAPDSAGAAPAKLTREPDSPGAGTAEPPEPRGPGPATPRPAVRSGEGGDPARPQCRKQKALRRERWRRKHGDAPVLPPPVAAALSLEQLLEPPDGAKHKLELRLVSASRRCEEYVSSKAASYQVYKQYQMAVHGDTEDKCSMTTYERFLCNSPLKGDPPYGSYHQQYWLDGELIAVGVLDVLPACVSSKYFFYLPRYGFLSLGTYSSLRELALTRQLQRSRAELRYYYMGYYIHSCAKMRYKGRLWPSALLCPETYTWHAIAACQAQLGRHKYARFAAPAPPAPAEREPDLAAALVLYGGRPMAYRRYRQLSGAQDEHEMRQYLGMVGARVAAQTLVYRE